MYVCEAVFNHYDENLSCVLVMWELRPHPCDGRVVETNKLWAYLYASNTNLHFLGGEDVLLAVAKHVVSYCSKNLVKTTNVLSGMVKSHVTLIKWTLQSLHNPETRNPLCSSALSTLWTRRWGLVRKWQQFSCWAIHHGIALTSCLLCILGVQQLFFHVYSPEC